MTAAVLTEATEADTAELEEFLGLADLTLSGLDSTRVRIWIERSPERGIVGSAGYEISEDGKHALIRSVAVHPEERSGGRGSVLARFALDRAEAEGVERAWLFSRRSGPFWQRLGFAPADKDELAEALAATHQVRLFRDSGQLADEVAWVRQLAA